MVPAGDGVGGVGGVGSVGGAGGVGGVVPNGRFLVAGCRGFLVFQA